jgi:hypothetical protein
MRSDIPIRQSMNVEMVGRDDLPNAIALNSTAFNGRARGWPAIGGMLIHWVGTAGCFALNAASFVPFLVNLTRMRLPHVETSKRAPTFADIREGFDFVRAHSFCGRQPHSSRSVRCSRSRFPT